MSLTSHRWALIAAALAAACSAKPPTTVAIAGPARPARTAAPRPPAEPIVLPGAPGAKEADEETDELPLAPEPGDGTPTRGWLGVELEPAGGSDPGVRVARVVPRSPAEAAGLRAGDLIVKVDGNAMASPSDVSGTVASHVAGDRVGIVLKRGQSDHLMAATLGSFPDGDQLQRMTFVDRPAPAFESTETAKGSVAPTLLAQRGQVVVLEFWAPWCVACRALIPHMNQWHAQYAARGVRVIGITGESVPRALLAANQLGMDYSILSDSTGRTTRAYQARAIPAVFVIDRRGTVRDVMVGYDPPRLAKLDDLVERLVAEP